MKQVNLLAPERLYWSPGNESTASPTRASLRLSFTGIWFTQVVSFEKLSQLHALLLKILIFARLFRYWNAYIGYNSTSFMEPKVNYVVHRTHHQISCPGSHDSGPQPYTLPNFLRNKVFTLHIFEYIYNLYISILGW
jgi:hypothetical protein